MSITSIPETVKLRLWGQAAGRCEYRGCGRALWEDDVSKAQFNVAYIAHIVADSPDGPRGDVVRSELLKKDISNLMVLCDAHHRLVDIAELPEHPEGRLLEMKSEHEQRMSLVGSIGHNCGSAILLYGASVGESVRLPRVEEARRALLPDWYPLDSTPVTLGLRNSWTTDRDPPFWQGERENLERGYETAIRPALREGSIPHLSVFGLAPQPLLIRLGTLLGDLEPADVYQLHREPATWKWLVERGDEQAVTLEPSELRSGPVALLVSLSATVAHSRIREVLGEDAAIWTMTIPEPHNDYLRTRGQLQQFRERMRRAFDQIKAAHGQGVPLHVFPAAPVAINVELGRVWMPKADMPMRLYDQPPGEPFRHAFDIGEVSS